eukprot:643015-Prymnesium_polylepis.4
MEKSSEGAKRVTTKRKAMYALSLKYEKWREPRKLHFTSVSIPYRQQVIKACTCLLAWHCQYRVPHE